MIKYSIVEHLKGSGKTYRELAKEMGLSYATVSKLFHAKTQADYELTVYALDKICRYFKLQPGELLKYRK